MKYIPFFSVWTRKVGRFWYSQNRKLLEAQRFKFCSTCLYS